MDREPSACRFICPRKRKENDGRTTLRLIPLLRCYPTGILYHRLYATHHCHIMLKTGPTNPYTSLHFGRLIPYHKEFSILKTWVIYVKTDLKSNREAATLVNEKVDGSLRCIYHTYLDDEWRFNFAIRMLYTFSISGLNGQGSCICLHVTNNIVWMNIEIICLNIFQKTILKLFIQTLWRHILIHYRLEMMSTASI